MNKDTKGIAIDSGVNIGTGRMVVVTEYATPAQNAMHPLQPNGLGRWSKNRGNALSIIPDHTSPLHAAHNIGP